MARHKFEVGQEVAIVDDRDHAWAITKIRSHNGLDQWVTANSGDWPTSWADVTPETMAAVAKLLGLPVPEHMAEPAPGGVG